MIPIDSVLKKSGVGKTQIEDVVLVGGSSRIPKFQEVIKNFLGKEELYCKINPDTAIASGAAVMAAVKSGEANEKAIDLFKSIYTHVPVDDEGRETIMLGELTKVGNDMWKGTKHDALNKKTLKK